MKRFLIAIALPAILLFAPTPAAQAADTPVTLVGKYRCVDPATVPTGGLGSTGAIVTWTLSGGAAGATIEAASVDLASLIGSTLPASKSYSAYLGTVYSNVTVGGTLVPSSVKVPDCEGPGPKPANRTDTVTECRNGNLYKQTYKTTYVLDTAADGKQMWTPVTTGNGWTKIGTCKAKAKVAGRVIQAVAIDRGSFFAATRPATF